MNIPKIVISPSEWAIVRDILQRHVPGREVWAFGSRAKWTSKEFSDLDLAIIGDEPLSITTLASLSEDFSESELPYKVDVVDWATTSESFRKIIEQDKVVIQMRGEESGTKTEWHVYKLGDVAEILTGFAFKGEQYLKAGAGIRVVRGDNVTEGMLRWGEKEKCWSKITPELETYRLNLGDVVIGMDGSKIGKNFAVVSESDNTCLLAQRVARLRAKPAVSQQYLRYAVCNSKFTDYVQTIKTGTSIPHISKRQIAEFKILAPSLKTQEEIAALLGALDDKISLLRETNTTLEAIAQALFKSWFVDFDPVRAKVEDREPEGIPPEIAALFPSEFEDSELGEIPQGWETRKVETLLTRLSAKVRYTKEQVSSSGSTPVYEQGAGIILGYHDSQGRFLATPEEPIFIFGDHTCVTHLSCEPFDISMNVIPLKGSDRPTLWTYYAIKDKQTFQEYRRHWMELAAKDVVVAPLAICNQFSLIASSLHVRMESNAWQANILAGLRDTLLPRLMSGKLGIPSFQEVST